MNIINSWAKWAICKLIKDNFSYLEETYDFQAKNVALRWVLLLPGSGCAWAKATGGCSMCGFKVKVDEFNKGKIPSHRQLMTFYRLGRIMVSGNSAKSLNIYNAGSFLNDTEIPEQTQIAICRKVGNHPTVERLVVESRPEFITDKRIKALLCVLKGKRLQVGIGLECQDDHIRNQIIRKGFLRKDYEKALTILKKHNAEVLTYVFLKPIHLSEEQAVDEAVKTIEYAFFSGSDKIALEAAFIQKGTVMEQLYNQVKYRPPWLWSIIEVIKKTHHYGPIEIGKFNDEPPPIAIPYNCPKCSPDINNRLDIYRKTNDIGVLEKINCGCWRNWQREFSQTKLKSLVLV